MILFAIIIVTIGKLWTFDTERVNKYMLFWQRDVVAYRKKFDYPMPDVRDPIGVIKEEDEHALKEVDKEPPAQADQGGGEGKDIGHAATVISTGANLISLNENMVCFIVVFVFLHFLP